MPQLELTPAPVALASLASYTSAGLVIPRLHEADTPGVINELSQALQREGAVPDLLPFYHTALNQELLSTTSVTGGLAFPHARLSGVKRLRFAFGRAPRPINWAGKSAWPVQLVFLVAIPATDAACYLHLLASLARLGQHAELVEELRATEESEAILAVFDKIKIRQG